MSNCLDYSLRKLKQEKFLNIKEINDLAILDNPLIPIELFVEKLSKYSQRIVKTEVEVTESYLVLTRIGNIYSLGAMVDGFIFLIDSQGNEKKFNHLAVERMIHSIWKPNKI